MTVDAPIIQLLRADHVLPGDVLLGQAQVFVVTRMELAETVRIHLRPFDQPPSAEPDTVITRKPDAMLRRRT